MKLFKRSKKKTNWKYILIVVILVVLIGGGLGYNYLVLKKEINEVIFDGSKYNYTNLNFSFEPPEQWAVTFEPSEVFVGGIFKSGRFKMNGDNFTVKLVVDIFSKKTIYASAFISYFQEKSREVCQQRGHDKDFCIFEILYSKYFTQNGMTWHRSALETGHWGFDFDVLTLSFPIRSLDNPDEIIGMATLQPQFEKEGITVENNTLSAGMGLLSAAFHYNFSLPVPPSEQEFWERSSGFALKLPHGYSFDPETWGGWIYLHKDGSEHRAIYVDIRALSYASADKYFQKGIIEGGILRRWDAGGPSGESWADKVLDYEKITYDNITGFKFYVQTITEFSVPAGGGREIEIIGPIADILLLKNKRMLSFEISDQLDDSLRPEVLEDFDEIISSARELSNFERTGVNNP